MKPTRPIVAIIIAVFAIAAIAVWAMHPDRPGKHRPPPFRHASDAANSRGDGPPFADADRMDLHKLARKVGKRWKGRLIGARPAAPHPAERRLGADRVLELRWLTPDRDLLMIRLDPRNGRILDVAGYDLERARK